MTDNAPPLRQIDWRSLCPWLLLLRVPRLALMPTPLITGALGVLLTALGWGLAARVFLGSHYLTEHKEERIAYEVQNLRDWPRPVSTAVEKRELSPTEYAALRRWHQPVVPSSLDQLNPARDSAFLQPIYAYVAPLKRLFGLEPLPLRELVFYVVGTLWMFAVWGAAGGIIVRSAVVRYAWEQPPDPWQTMQFVVERLASYASAPLYPLLGVALLMTPLAVAGLLARFNFGALFVSMFWFLGLLCSLAAVWLLIPLLFGFPLMWGAISSERDGDAFEALSNSIAYTYQRPLKYLGYAVLMVTLGVLSLLIVDGAASAVVHLGYWGLSWGSGGERALALKQIAEQSTDANGVLSASGWLLGLWTGLVYLLAAGFRYSFFWTAAAGIYLLLRKDVDDKEIDEVYLAHEEPQIRPISRAAAAPVVNEPTAPPPAEVESAPEPPVVS